MLQVKSQKIKDKKTAGILSFILYLLSFRGGYAALITTLLVVTISLTIIGGFTFFSMREVNMSRLFARSVESRYISEGGMEDALYRTIVGKQFTSGETLVVGTGTTTMTITASGTQRFIRTEGIRQNVQQNFETELDINVAGTNFFYGVQVGDGGLEMANNSRINGSVHSNGSILGDAGATITGDAFVAVAVPPAVNQSWETQNTDFSVGTATGSITTIVDSAGNVGTYTSLVIGSDGFARISYVDDTNGDLKFVRCLDAACAAKNISSIDTAGVIGEVTSLVLGSDGFGRISYYHDGNDDLKFARCTNADCTSKNIATVDSSGTVGQYTSLALGSDGFARISYYYSSGGDLRFARCTDADCAGKVIATVDSAPTVGKYTSLGLGGGDAGRISYYDEPNGNLNFAFCLDQNCSPQSPQIDVAQSFQPSISDRLTAIQLYLKKAGNPANSVLRIIRDSSGSPSTNPSDVIASTTIDAAVIGSAYSWVNFTLAAAPNLSANTTYWIVVDSSFNNSNYLIWGLDSAGGYTRGSPKRSADWMQGGWLSVGGDLNFRAYMGGIDTSIEDVTVGGNASAHVMDGVDVAGNVQAYSYNDGIVGGNIHANSISNCTVNGAAEYNTKTACTVLGSQTTPTTPPADPARLDMPIPDSVIRGWKNDAASGGACVPPQCLANGDYDPTQCSVSLGPKKITGNLILDDNCAGGQTLTLTGTVWVIGNIDISNSAKIIVSPGYGELSGVMVADGTIHLSNNGTFSGSGTSGSYLMLLTTISGGGHHGSAIDLHNNASGAIFYASNGMIWLHNNVNVIELTGYKIHLENNASIFYEIGLQNVGFSSGPAGGFDVRYWKEVE